MTTTRARCRLLRRGIELFVVPAVFMGCYRSVAVEADPSGSAATSTGSGTSGVVATSSAIGPTVGPTTSASSSTGATGCQEAGFMPLITYPTGVQPDGLGVADFNGDGALDLAVANGNIGMAGSVGVFLGHGDGTFGVPWSFATQSYTTYLVVGDFNEDGKSDIAVACQSNEVDVFLGIGDGTFTVGASIRVPEELGGLAVGDFNGDGAPDIAVGGTYQVNLLFGEGNGSFADPVALRLSPWRGSGAGSIFAGDLNGDGHLDLLTDFATVNAVDVLLGYGDGGVSAEASYPTGGEPFGVWVGDLSRDGVLDIAVANGSDETVGVLIGNGDGTFKPQVTYGTGSIPNWVVSGDFNGDSVPDLAVTNSSTSSVSVLLGIGDGTFQEATLYSVGDEPTKASAGDFNGDGLDDLAVIGSQSDSVTILLAKGCSSSRRGP
jgi:hypothetical protein